MLEFRRGVQQRHRLSTCRMELQQNASEQSQEIMSRMLEAFFGEQHRMQRTIIVLCENNLKQNTDTLTPTILIMLTCPLQIQLTAVGWQPFKSKDLTFPYNKMSQEQREIFRNAIPSDENQFNRHWGVFEHAMTFRRSGCSKQIVLKPLDVLGALCTSVLGSHAYPDKRLRVAICNILLQRVQASVPLDKHTQSSLNERLFPPSAPVTPEDREAPLEEQDLSVV